MAEQIRGNAVSRQDPKNAKGREASAWAARSAPFPGSAGFQARLHLAEALVPRAAQCATGILAGGDFPGTAGFQARKPKGRCMGRAMLYASAAD